jgi:hypothetical protein
VRTGGSRGPTATGTPRPRNVFFSHYGNVSASEVSVCLLGLAGGCPIINFSTTDRSVISCLPNVFEHVFFCYHLWMRCWADPCDAAVRCVKFTVCFVPRFHVSSYSSEFQLVVPAI